MAAAGVLVAACLVFGITDDPRLEKWLIVHLVGAAGLLVLWRWQWNLPHYIALAFLLYMTISLAWSPDWRAGALEIRDAIALLSAGWLLSRMGPVWIARGTACTALGLIGLDLLVPNGGQGNPNFVAELLVLLVPWCFFGWWSLAGLVSIGYLLTLEPNLIWVAVMAFVLAVAWCASRRAVLWASLGLAVAAGLMMRFSADVWSSVGARAEFWWNTATMWLDRPVFGWGAGSYDWAYPLFQERHLEIWPSLDTKMHPITTYAGYAHNELLQVLAQFGLAGVLILAAGIAALVFSNGDIRAKWTLWLAFAISMVGFPAHNPATGLVIMLSAAVLASSSASVRLPSFLSRRRFRLGRTYRSQPSGL